MRPLLALLLTLVAFAPETDARRRAVAHRPPFTVPALDGIAASALERGIPGLTIGVRKGSSLYVKSYGTPPPGAVYQIASVSKQFTAAAIMRLADQAKLRVEDKARTWLPELDQRFDAITIEHLLTHTSGVRDYNEQLTTPYEPKTQQEIFALIISGPPLFSPGARFVYSNSGYFLLGMIIERASSQTYAQYLRDAFFTPLGLRETSYCDPAPDGWYIDTNGSVHAIPAADMSLAYAAGALCSSAGDLLRWNEALAAGRVVSPQSYARMTTSVDPRNTPPPGYGYALVLDTFEGRRRIWHNGAILGFMSHLAGYPDEQLSVVVLVNAMHLSRDLATEIADQVARAVMRGDS